MKSAKTKTKDAPAVKPLSKKYTRKAFHYEQIAREGNVAIYKKSMIDGISFSYEVIIIKSHEGYTIKENTIEPSELYPGDGKWGMLGFTHNDLGRAKKQFDQLKKLKTA